MKKSFCLIIVLIAAVFCLSTIIAQEVQPEAKPEAKAETKPAPAPEPAPPAEPKPEAKAEPAQEVKPEAKAEPGPEVRPDTKPVAKEAPAMAPRAEVKSETKPAGTTVNPGPRPAPKAEPRPAARAAGKPDVQPGPVPAAKTETKPAAKEDSGDEDDGDIDDEEEMDDDDDESCSILAEELKFDAALKEAESGAALADFFSRDAVTVSSTVMKERPWASGVEDGQSVSLKPFTVKVSSSCDVGYVVGDWVETRNGKVIWGGQYVNVWKKVKKQWKICAHARNIIPRGYKAEKRENVLESVSGYDKKGRPAVGISTAVKDFFRSQKQGGWAKAYDIYADRDIMRIRQNSEMMRGKKQVFLKSVIERAFIEAEIEKMKTARGGDIAVVWGGAEAKGPQPYQEGSFLHVWTRDNEGAWKLSVDFLMLGGSGRKKSIL